MVSRKRRSFRSLSHDQNCLRKIIFSTKIEINSFLLRHIGIYLYFYKLQKFFGKNANLIIGLRNRTNYPFFVARRALQNMFLKKFTFKIKILNFEIQRWSRFLYFWSGYVSSRYGNVIARKNPTNFFYFFRKTFNFYL